MIYQQPLNSKYPHLILIREIIYQIPKFIFSLLDIPGFVKPLEYPDRVTGDYIRIRISSRFTIISVNNRDYYFKRLTGRFGGTGYALCSCSPIEEQLHYILADIPESTHPLGLWGRLKRVFQSIGWGCFC